MYTIILAGGLGKRMNSSIPKVLHTVNKIPMVCHVINEALKLDTQKILIVVGRYKDLIESKIRQFFSEEILQKITYITQKDQTIDGKIKTMGTGDAVRCCIPHLKSIRKSGDEKVVILSGDVPLIKHTTIELLLSKNNTLLTSNIDEPFGCGRVFINKYDVITQIVEEKDCNDEQRKCCHVNCGIYNLNIDTIINYVPLIQNNTKSSEYYLTDIVEISIMHGVPINRILLPHQSISEILNVNTPNDLEIANSKL